MKRCLIFVGGEVKDYSWLAQELREGDYLLAVDSGARHLAALGRTPHLLVGDMDSVDAGLLVHIRGSGTECRVYRPEKDETDGELAVREALASGAESVRIYGIHGNRLDHFLAVLSLLVRFLKAGTDARMVSENQELWLIEGGQRLDLPAGTLISFLPFGDRAEGVTLEGFRYPLTDYDYRQGTPIGVSNVIEKSPAEVFVRQGILIAVHTVRE